MQVELEVHMRPARSTSRWLLVSVVALIAAFLTPSWQAGATATFTVTTTSDGVDATPGDGLCDGGSGACTLRGAIMEANALAGHDEITLPAGVYTLTIGGASEDGAATGDLDITSDLRIVGTSNGTDVSEVDGNGLDRVFDVRPGATADLRYFWMAGGAAPSGTSGGGIRVDGATLWLSAMSLEVNGTSGGGSGAGIFLVNGSWAQITDSNVSVNTVTGVGGGGGIYAGGPSDTITIANSTVAYNTANSVGGIAVNGSLNVTGSTIASNSTSSGASNLTVASLDPSSSVTDTIIADGIGGSSCDGPVPVTGGGNFENGLMCGFTDPTDISFTPVKLGSYGTHGGPVPTMSLSPRSPAIDAGLDPGCPAFDARGVPRPQGRHCDPGAYEYMTCAGMPVGVIGSNGNDHIVGTAADDSVATFDLADQVKGGRGDDHACGGSGNDKLQGGPGSDVLVGGKGRDVCIGGPGKDRAISCEVTKGL